MFVLGHYLRAQSLFLALGALVRSGVIFRRTAEILGAEFKILGAQLQIPVAPTPKEYLTLQKEHINCNFCQASSKHLITLEPKVLPFLLKIVIKNLVSEGLACVLARRARKKRKLLARRENLLVRDNWTGFFLSPESDSSICIQ